MELHLGVMSDLGRNAPTACPLGMTHQVPWRHGTKVQGTRAAAGSKLAWMLPRPPSRTVLVIDDYAAVRFTIAELLREESFDVTEAASGAEGLAVLSRLERPCLVLLELALPDMDGDEFANRLRALPRADTFRLLIVTGRSHAPLPPGATGLLQKPFDVQQLLSLVEAHSPL